MSSSSRWCSSVGVRTTKATQKIQLRASLYTRVQLSYGRIDEGLARETRLTDDEKQEALFMALERRCLGGC